MMITHLCTAALLTLNKTPTPSVKLCPSNQLMPAISASKLWYFKLHLVGGTVAHEGGRDHPDHFKYIIWQGQGER
jgi:hypothetical protein